MQFGTSGLRGLVTEMTDPVCSAWVRAFLFHLRQVERFDAVLVGRDRRPSSERISAACRSAIAAEGLSPLDCGVLPTPALAFAAAARGLPAVMVTGSHIPFDRNGLKFYRAAGEIGKADEAAIAAAVRQPVAGLPPACGRIVAAGESYVQRSVVFFGADCLRELRIGVFEHSAAGRDLLSDALRRMGGETIGLGRTDDFVPVDTEAIAVAEADRIRDWVLAERLDALVSTDGDGDRPLIADETGSILRGDEVGALAAHLLGADAVAAPINASTALERSGWFARTLRTRIGSPYVVAGLAALSAEGARLPVGYEANGGFLIGAAVERDGRQLDPLPTRDAMVSQVAILAEVARTGRPLSHLRASLPRRVTASGRLQAVPEAVSGRLLDALAASAAAREAFVATMSASKIVEVDSIDGIRLRLVSGEIVQVRASGNAPELRCYGEADSAARAEALVGTALETMTAMLEAAP